MKVGHWYVFRHAVYDFAVLINSYVSNLQYLSVNIWAGAGMGIFTRRSTNILYDNVKVQRINNRPMSTTADATHFIFCYGIIQVMNSIFEGFFF